MKKLGFLLVAVCLSIFTIGVSGCKEAEDGAKKVGDAAKDAADATGDAAKDAADDVADAAKDAADDVKDAVEGE